MVVLELEAFMEESGGEGEDGGRVDVNANLPAILDKWEKVIILLKNTFFQNHFISIKCVKTT